MGWFSLCETQSSSYKRPWFREVQVLALAQQAGKAPGAKQEHIEVPLSSFLRGVWCLQCIYLSSVSLTLVPKGSEAGVLLRAQICKCLSAIVEGHQLRYWDFLKINCF